MSTLPWQSLRASLPWLGCAWLLALPAFAQPRIDWQASEGCPSVDEGRAQIEQLLHAPLTELAIDLAAAVRLRRDAGSAFSATIEVLHDGVARKRVLHSADCAVLAHASAMIVALAIDPTARVDEPSSASGAHAATAVPATQLAGSPPTAASAPAAQAQPFSVSGAVPPTAASAAAVQAQPLSVSGSPSAAAQAQPLSVSGSPPTAASAPTVPRSPAPPASEGGKGAGLRPWLGVGLGLDAGNLPKLAPALALVAGLETSWSRAALRLTYAPAQRATASDLPGVSGRVGLAAAAIEAGLRWYLARLELSSLVGMEAGAFAARGSEGVSDQATKRPFWLGGYLAGRIALLANANFTVSLRLDGIIALRRPSFVLRGDLGENRTLHRPNPVSGRGWLELELHFPL